MGLSSVRAWLFIGAFAVAACSDSHEADETQDPGKNTDPVTTRDGDEPGSDNARVGADAPDTPPVAKPPEGMPGVGPLGPLMDAGPGKQHDRPAPDADARMPMPPEPKRDGAMPTPPPAPDPLLDGGPMPPKPPKPHDPKPDGGPQPKPERDKDDASAPDAGGVDAANP